MVVQMLRIAVPLVVPRRGRRSQTAALTFLYSSLTAQMPTVRTVRLATAAKSATVATAAKSAKTESLRAA
jgi:hypothetical protein